MPLFILPIEETTGASHEGFIIHDEPVCHTCTCPTCVEFGEFDNTYDQGASHEGFNIDEFNANNSELYFKRTKTNCRVCDGEIFANNMDAICDCDLPF